MEDQGEEERSRNDLTLSVANGFQAADYAAIRRL